jgi:3-oxoadipate enol-lactonase
MTIETPFCYDQGQGRPILWVHGFPLDHTMWMHQIEGLDGFRHLAVDLRGFGKSACLPVDKMSMSLLSEDLRKIVEERIGSEPFVYAGLSMGGYIAWPFIQDPPANLRGLILCDTRAAADSEEAARARRISAERVLSEGSEHVVAAMLEKLFAAGTRTANPDRIEATRQVMQATPPESIAAALRAMADRPNSTERLNQLDVPTLLVCGEHDQITSVAEMSEMATQIRGCRLAVIPGAGHMAPLEQPDAVNLVLREFLGSVLG